LIFESKSIVAYRCLAVYCAPCVFFLCWCMRNKRWTIQRTTYDLMQWTTSLVYCNVHAFIGVLRVKFYGVVGLSDCGPPWIPDDACQKSVSYRSSDGLQHLAL